MSPEKQRIAIAEACGWTEIEMEDFSEYGITCFIEMGMNPSCGQRMMLPDYLQDLNAMYEAEKVLTKDKWIWLRFVNEINDICPNEWISESIHATAAQRAEAFLKTLGLWEDEE